MSVNKITAERNAKAVQELALQPGNDVCADCKTRNPRWASHNLGIFICVNCASIHRKIGTHITKVKSLSLDSWSKEQIESMRQNGNIKSNSYYNPDEVRNPPPTNMIDSERDSDLEKFIRDKYEYKRFVSKSSIVESYLGPSRSLASATKATPTRSATAPLSGPPTANKSSLPSSASVSSSFSSPAIPPRTNPYSSPPSRSTTQPLSAPVQTSQFQQPPPQQQQQKPGGGVWDDLLALQSPQAPTHG
ncbi:putative GTPase activating protein for Arf-domain-containing protein [Amylostereum chailletii]|nr:putative GTPase activating protein for Arf-domain-containing protein [Amylostereum chailletii]